MSGQCPPEVGGVHNSSTIQPLKVWEVEEVWQVEEVEEQQATTDQEKRDKPRCAVEPSVVTEGYRPSSSSVQAPLQE